MISYKSFHDELTKIAADRTVTKGRLKQGLMAALATGAGAGLGEGVGQLARRFLLKPKGVRLGAKVPPSMMRYAPALAGGLGGLGMILMGIHALKAGKMIDEGK